MRCAFLLLVAIVSFAPAAASAAGPVDRACGVPQWLDALRSVDGLPLAAESERRRMVPGVPPDQREMPAVVARFEVYLHWTAGSACETQAHGPSIELAPRGSPGLWRSPPSSLAAISRCVIFCRLLL